MQFITRSLSLTLALCLIGCVLQCENCCAEQQTMQSSEQAPQQADGVRPLEPLINRLGSDSYAERRQAFAEIWQAGESAKEVLDLADRSEDKQIIESARRLKLLINCRSHCDDIQTAKELIELLETPTLENLFVLASKDQWELAHFLLDEQPALAIRAQESFYQGVESRYLIQRLVDLALSQEKVETAWPLVARLIPADLAAWTAIHLNVPLPNQPVDQHELAMQLFLAGKIEEALSQSLSPQLKLKLAISGFRWDVLKEPWLQRALLGDQKSTSQEAAMAVLLDYSGDREASAQAWARIVGVPAEFEQPEASAFSSPQDASESREHSDPFREAALAVLRQASGTPEDPSSFHQLVLSLLLSGRVDVIERFLEESAPHSAFDFYMVSNDYANAFRQVGLEPDMSNFENWLERLVADAEVNLPEALRNQSYEISSLKSAMTLGKMGSTLVGLGYRTESDQILDELIRLGQRSFRRQNPIWERCILRWMSRDEWRTSCIKGIEEQFDRLPRRHQPTIFAKLFPGLGVHAWNLMLAAPAMRDSLPRDQQRKLALEQLDHLERCDREYFGSDAELIIKDWLYRAMNRTIDEENSSPEDGDSVLSLAKIAHTMGYSRLAIDLLRIGRDQTLDSYNLLHLAANISLDSHDPRSALQYLDASLPGSSDQHRDHSTRIRARLVLGQFEKARQEDLAHWLRMSGVSWNGDRSVGYRVAEDLISEHRWEEALPYAERNFQLDRFVSHYLRFWEARQYSWILQELKEYERSADVMRAVFVELLRPFSQTLRFFIENDELSLIRYCAIRERISRAAGLIHKEQFPAVLNELEIAFRMNPLDIEAVVCCYPGLVEAKQTEIAELVFRKYESALLTHLERWPNDAMNLNNLAWMYSQCDRQLDDALVLSERATELAPSSAVYLDTLAEVHFRMGNAAYAVQLMRDCVRMNPREPHYRENLARFSKSDPK